MQNTIVSAKFVHTCVCIIPTTVLLTVLPTDQVQAKSVPIPLSTPQPTPMIETTTCSALEKLAAYSGCTADTVEPCDKIYCKTQQLPGKTCPVVVTLMLCTTPAGVRIEMKEENKVVLNKVLYESKNILLQDLFGFVMNVTLEHFENAIGLQVGTKLHFFKYQIMCTLHCILHILDL